MLTEDWHAVVQRSLNRMKTVEDVAEVDGLASRDGGVVFALRILVDTL
jgi:hypothetical protein